MSSQRAVPWTAAACSREAAFTYQPATQNEHHNDNPSLTSCFNNAGAASGLCCEYAMLCVLLQVARVRFRW